MDAVYKMDPKMSLFKLGFHALRQEAITKDARTFEKHFIL